MADRSVSESELAATERRRVRVFCAAPPALTKVPEPVAAPHVLIT